MKITTINKPIEETKKVVVGTKEIIVYECTDGQQFTNDNDRPGTKSAKQWAEEHEAKLAIIEANKDQFIEVNRNYTNFSNAFAQLLFDAYGNVSNSSFFIWSGDIGSTDAETQSKVDTAISYLRAVGIGGIYPKDLTEVLVTFSKEEIKEKRTQILICDWVENENSDRPDYNVKCMKFHDAIVTLNAAVNDFEKHLIRK